MAKGVAARQRSSMGSDGDQSGDENEKGGYSDDSEPELEAGCMGVKDPREMKRETGRGQERLRTCAFMACFFALGAYLPFVLLVGLEAALPQDMVAKSERALGAVGDTMTNEGTRSFVKNATFASLPPGAFPAASVADYSGLALAGRTGGDDPAENMQLKNPALHMAPSFAGSPSARFAEVWGSTSDKVKDVLRAHVKAGTLTLEPLRLEDELDEKELVFASGEGSCHDVCNANGKQFMCSPDWFRFLNRCEVVSFSSILHHAPAIYANFLSGTSMHALSFIPHPCAYV